MARSNYDAPAGIAWDADPEAQDYIIYVDATDDNNFAELADSGQWPEHARVTATEYLFLETDPDDADWLVISHAIIDGVEFWSDPHTPAAWQDIDLDGQNPLAGAINGRLIA